MKKTLLLIAFLGSSLLLKAQSTTYKAFKVDVDLGYAIPTGNSGSGTKAGVTFTIEPHYRLSDAFAVGLRFEGAGLGYVNNSGINSSVQVSILNSYCATGEYYFVEEGFRPFAGAGMGFFTRKSLSVDSSSVASNSGNTLVSGGTKFGFFPRVGFEYGHLRVSAEYNILGNNSNYIAFKLGFFFGGGRKD